MIHSIVASTRTLLTRRTRLLLAAIGDVPTATAIEIDGNDHYISDTIVFSSLVGLQMNGAANYVGGLHVWFPWNAAGDFDAVAFVEKGGQNRYEGCYIDCSHMLFSSPSLVTFQDGFVLGGGITIQGSVTKLVITDTEFQGGTIAYDGSGPVVDTSITRNVFTGTAKGSIATAVLSSDTPMATWSFDFCSSLVFANITAIRHSFTCSDAGVFPMTVSRPPVDGGCRVVVEVKPAASGVMVVDVDTSVGSH